MPHNSHFHKRHLILNIINHLGPISRTELINITDYRPATVTDITKELLDEQLLLETGNYSSGHGRRRTLLEINKKHLCGVGIAFSPDSVTLILSQFDGTILRQDKFSFQPEVPKEELIEEIAAHTQTLISDLGDKEILGIGIGDPAHDPTGYQSGHSLHINYSHFNDWVHFGLKPRLEALTGLRVETYSPVTLPVMAEQRFGVAKGAQNFICIELSNGIGSSICCNGMAVGGANGVAGELGHMVIDYASPSSKLCYCGKPGCAETTTAFPALVSALESALDHGIFSVLNTHLDDRGRITVSAIRKSLEENDRMCMYYVKEVTSRLGVVISNFVNLLNPELVVLYGFMLQLGDYFLDQLTASIRENVLSVASDFDIRISDSIDAILPLGAVAEIFSSYLHSDDFKWVYQLQRNGDEL